MMGTADIPYFCYGFSNMATDSLMLAGPVNLTSGENKMKVSASEGECYLISDSLVNETGKHNELDFARYQGGKKVQPDYIVVFRKNGEIKNFEKAKTAQQQWGGLPIVIVDQDKCLESEKAKTDELFKEFEETSNPEALKDAIQKIRNNRQTDENFCSDKNLETLTKQLNGMQKYIKEPKSQVTIQDLAENYEMVPAVDRQNESSKISRIFARVKQIQKEGAGYEL